MVKFGMQDKEEISIVLKKITAIKRHIKNVQDNAEILGTKLIERGDVALGINLIANSMIHDNSKFFGLEFDHMFPGEKEDLLNLAIDQHRRTNRHHAEFWAGLENMPKIYLAELICDLKARSEEFGTDLKAYISGPFTEKCKLSPNSRVSKNIKDFLNLLLEPAFKTT